MPTSRGWGLLGAGLSLILLWWLLGDEELLMAGAFFLMANAAALVYVRLFPPKISVSRRLGAGAVHDGDTVQVTLTIDNPGRRRLRNVRLIDQVEGLGVANFEIATVGADERLTAVYRVQCRPRGIYRVGPLVAGTTDPLGLAAIDSEQLRVDQLIVYPAVEALSGYPVVRGQDPSMAAARPEHAQRGGEDFYTLREYQRGDDLRRVHWPSSARTDQLMIRQLETPWQSRALVLLDVRRSVYESELAFETAVSGAASVVSHLVRSGFDADLWAGDPNAMDATRYSAAMEKLALVQTRDDIDIEAVASRLKQKGGGGALMLITGTADRPLLSVQRLLGRDYPTTILLAAAGSTSQTIAGFHRLGVATVTTEPGSPWAPRWLESIGEAWDAASAR